MPTNKFLFALVATMLSGCVLQVPPLEPEKRTANAENLAKTAGFEREWIKTTQFDILSYGTAQKSTNLLTIYIEGDGHAWENTFTPSKDPTPINPLGLILATKDTNQAVAYLARPCQFTFNNNQKGCHEGIWTDQRFSSEIISNINEAIDHLKKRYQAQKLILIGYSGGGAIAVICAAKRPDVIQLVTVAGNLDIVKWTSYHKLSSLNHSLNPVDFTDALEKTSQIHFIGGADEVVPKLVLEGYLAHYKNPSLIRVFTMPDYDHVCCWKDEWKARIDQFRGP